MVAQNRYLLSVKRINILQIVLVNEITSFCVFSQVFFFIDSYTLLLLFHFMSRDPAEYYILGRQSGRNKLLVY